MTKVLYITDGMHMRFHYDDLQFINVQVIQSMLKGYIEHVVLDGETNAYVNEDGKKLPNCEYNALGSLLYTSLRGQESIYGPMIVFGPVVNGAESSVTRETVLRCAKLATAVEVK